MRREGEKGVGSIPAIRCNVGKRVNGQAAKSGVSEKQCIWICGSDDPKVITTKEGTKQTLKSCNTPLNILSISSYERLAT